MTAITYRHWRDVPKNRWRWKHFSPAEIACRGTGSIRVHEEALDRLQALRERLGKPLIVLSAYRSVQHNRAIGGAPRSKHHDGTAFDIAMVYIVDALYAPRYHFRGVRIRYGRRYCYEEKDLDYADCKGTQFRGKRYTTECGLRQSGCRLILFRLGVSRYVRGGYEGA